MRSLLLLLALICALPGLAGAQAVARIDATAIRVCPADSARQAPPDFASETCRTQAFHDIDPQGREMWIEARIALGPEHLAGTRPLGLFISAKASSAIYVNGHFIGANGQPGADRASEEPGRMDAVLYLPRALLRDGENTIVLHLSSMHGLLQLRAPMHILAIGPYGDPTQHIVRAYWPSLITFGAFVLGFVFFGITALRGEDREGSAILSLASLFAGAQLIAEAGRGLMAYAYPLHDVRLMAIAACAFGFSLCLVAYLLLRLSGLGFRARMVRLAAIAAVLMAVVLLGRGFDAKTGFALLAAALAGMGWSLVWVWQKKPGAWAYLAVMAGFAGLLLVFTGRFLDLYFFYAAAAILLYLFYRQALTLVRERRRRQAEEVRAGRLETALAQARQRAAPAQLQLVSAGRTDYVSTDRIVQLKGAGDYVEVHFEDGRTALYNGALTALESELPPTFIRVHRSHIVNTAFVTALERDASSTGRLILSNGTEVPVSRRIMPKVRSALADAAE